LGVFVALARQYPYYIGSDEHGIALDYAANALGWSKILCSIQIIIFLIPAVFSINQKDYISALGWCTQIIVAPTAIYMSYLANTYRNSNDFITWSKGNIIISFVSLILLPIVVFWQFFAVCMRNSIPNLVSVIYLHWNRPLKIESKFNIKILKNMIMFGAPIMILGYISTSLWDALTRSYILQLTSERDLGLYAFAGTICTAVRTVAISISQVFHPRIAQLYGTSGKNIHLCFNYSLRLGLIGMVVLLPFIGLIYYAIDPLLREFLPKYIECVLIIKLLCWWAALPVIDLPSQVLIVAKKTKEYSISVLIGFVLFIVIIIFIGNFDRTILLQEIVMIYVVCKVARAIVADFFAWWVCKKSIDIK
jgi:hypothetical protein